VYHVRKHRLPEEEALFASHGSFGTVLVALAIVGGTEQTVHSEKMSSVRRLTREEDKITHFIKERETVTKDGVATFKEAKKILEELRSMRREEGSGRRMAQG
jgi:hypothetical protein